AERERPVDVLERDDHVPALRAHVRHGCAHLRLMARSYAPADANRSRAVTRSGIDEAPTNRIALAGERGSRRFAHGTRSRSRALPRTGPATSSVSGPPCTPSLSIPPRSRSW